MPPLEVATAEILTKTKEHPNRINEKTKEGDVSETSSTKKMLHLLKWAYFMFWHKVSMDPAVNTYGPLKPGQKRPPLFWLCYIRFFRCYMVFAHTSTIVGFLLCIFGYVKGYTTLFAILLGIASSIGATAGAHRLWSHHSFKATWQLRFMLMIFQTLSLQYSIVNWARDHRLHHKYSDTEADPHNSKRGFFFCHIGWLITLPNPEVAEKIKAIDVKDVLNDPIAAFQDKFYWPFLCLVNHILPTVIPWYFWGENVVIAHIVCCQLRHIVTLNSTFLINSAAHMWGNRPYDANIRPTENKIVSAATFGDGWHNYHHAFPWDYRNSEYWDYKLNISTAFIDLFALIGWAYDRKTVPVEMAARKAQKSGDGTHHSIKKNVWGWNDKDLLQDERQNTIIT